MHQVRCARPCIYPDEKAPKRQKTKRIDRTGSADSLEYKEYRTGSSLDHQANVLSGISFLVWRPYKYKVYDKGTTATQGLSA